ncbi:arginase family protein [Agromyces seonyuensis]|uniref:Arginase family protein n=1 Tax=Agromyces seonyuensis TaxID=2662446 RepID=A0A6I4NX46_9MICO|nr:arginase family protein [Agromyces seonyuensis]MWB98808.1 arginase family protein [Agromyces seonyuensis]
MPVTFVVIPQWQGSVSTRAMSHADGAHAIAGDLPSRATRFVDVPTEAGESLGSGVKRYSTLARVRERIAAALAEAPGWPFLVGGDCGVSVSALEHLRQRDADDGLAVLWLDAHPDLHSPESSPSGGFGGMSLRAILGDGAEGLALRSPHALAPSRLVIGGARSIDPGEHDYAEAHGIPLLTVEDLADPAVVIGALEAAGARSVYVHVDLDVLDPGALSGLSYPLPFGASAETLAALLRAVATRFPVAGAAVAGFAPGSPEQANDDLPTILRLIGAVTAGAKTHEEPQDAAS